MRVSNNQIYSQSSRAISNANDRNMEAQKKITENTSIVSPSDNPVGASQVMQYESSNQYLKQYDNNMKMAQGHLEYEEVALQSFNGLLDDARTLLIQADNTANDNQDLNAISDQVSSMVDSMEDLMNSRSADGSYIFSGTDTQIPAFTHLPDGSFKWSGNEGQKFAQISEHRKIAVNDSGKALFDDVWTRNHFSSTVSLGSVALTSKVSNQDDFDEFMKQHYSATDKVSNNFVLTTTPLSMNSPDVAAIQNLVSQRAQDALNGVGANQQDGNKDHYVGPPGRYFLADSSGKVIASGTYDPNKNLNIQGMSFSLQGAPGAIVDVNLDQPKRDNVVNVLRETIKTLRDPSSDHDARDIALKNGQDSIVNTQTSIGQVRSTVGARLNSMNERGDFSSANQLSNTMAQERVAGLDMGKAATELSMSTTALDASQKLFTRISNLSLFNKI